MKAFTIDESGILTPRRCICGGRPVGFERRGVLQLITGGPGCYRIQCPHCLLEGPLANDWESAAEAWSEHVSAEVDRRYRDSPAEAFRIRAARLRLLQLRRESMAIPAEPTPERERVRALRREESLLRRRIAAIREIRRLRDGEVQ